MRARCAYVFFSTLDRDRCHISASAAVPLSTAAAWSLRRIALTMVFTCGIARAALS
jgi:hypothetical protein